MLSLCHVDTAGERHVDLSIDDVDAALADGWIWIDSVDPSDEDLRFLAQRFDLDRMTREDLRTEELQFPKVDEVGSYLVLVTHGLAADEEQIRTVEIDFVVGPNWLLTVRAEPLLSFDHVRDRFDRRAFALEGPDHLMARLVEFSSERFLPLLDVLDEQLLDLDGRAIDGDPAVLPYLQLLRREITVIRRVLVPQRTAVGKALRSEALGDRARRELSDAMDHHVRLVESLDSAHGLLQSAVDTYRGATAERMNEIMKVLTVYSAIILPLSLIAGIYGMNFAHMPELDQRWAYPATLGLMAAIATGLYAYFVRRQFIGGPSLRAITSAGRGAGRGAVAVGKGAAKVGVGLASLATAPVRGVGRVVVDGLRSPDDR